MSKYKIDNPSKTPRVIYDGSKTPRPISIPPGKMAVGVEISDDIARELQDRAEAADKAGKIGTELVVTPKAPGKAKAAT